MLRRYVEQIMSLYNYIDGLIIVNKDGKVEFFSTFRSDINSLKEEEVIGKHILEVYPDLTEETSSVMSVLKTGTPIFNQYQRIKNFLGEELHAVNTTLPIRDQNENIIGIVDFSRYVNPEIENKNVRINFKKNKVSKVENLFCVDDIITDSNNMLEVIEKIKKISNTDSSVLIYGETGTGKELIAQSIHTSSYRKTHPFISQNCAAIPSTLLESILFGTEKGSYTGAEDKKGLFELANKGTLFLDEINSMEISIQAKILKAIEEKKIRRLGGEKTIELDVRIIAAVNEKPTLSLKENKIRKDLFFRLATVQINLPLLKSRRNDIMLLTNYFINEYNIKMNKYIIGVTEEVEDIFKKYHWPGNVRELRNVIEGSFNLVSGKFIKKSDLPEYIMVLQDSFEINRLMNDYELSLPERIQRIESKIISDTLIKSKNQVEAAKELQISKQLLRFKINKYNL